MKAMGKSPWLMRSCWITTETWCWCYRNHTLQLMVTSSGDDHSFHARNVHVLFSSISLQKCSYDLSFHICRMLKRSKTKKMGIPTDEHRKRSDRWSFLRLSSLSYSALRAINIKESSPRTLRVQIVWLDLTFAFVGTLHMGIALLCFLTF